MTEVLARLQYAAVKVPDNARKVMRRTADAIVVEAKINTPHDTGELEDSIREEIGYAGRGRLQIEILVGGMVRGVNVDLYAVQVHENYEGMLVHGPGPGTLAKMAAYPDHYIGSKFLERAVDKYRPKLMKAMIEAIVKEI